MNHFVGELAEASLSYCLLDSEGNFGLTSLNPNSGYGASFRIVTTSTKVRGFESHTLQRLPNGWLLLLRS